MQSRLTDLHFRLLQERKLSHEARVLGRDAERRADDLAVELGKTKTQLEKLKGQHQQLQKTHTEVVRQQHQEREEAEVVLQPKLKLKGQVETVKQQYTQRNAKVQEQRRSVAKVHEDFTSKRANCEVFFGFF